MITEHLQLPYTNNLRHKVIICIRSSFANLRWNSVVLVTTADSVAHTVVSDNTMQETDWEENKSHRRNTSSNYVLIENFFLNKQIHFSRKKKNLISQQNNHLKIRWICNDNFCIFLHEITLVSSSNEIHIKYFLFLTKLVFLMTLYPLENTMLQENGKSKKKGNRR